MTLNKFQIQRIKSKNLKKRLINKMILKLKKKKMIVKYYQS